MVEPDPSLENLARATALLLTYNITSSFPVRCLTTISAMYSIQLAVYEASLSLGYIILNGFSKHISNKRIKSILVEITENYKEQKNYVENIMRKSNFVLQNKEQSEISRKGSSKTFNYIYYKKI